MTQRRFFLKKSFGGACAVLLSSGVFAPFAKKWAGLAPVSDGTNENLYKIKFIYAFESESMRASLLPKIENVSFIEAVNRKYQQAGQIVSFNHEQDQNLVSNLYVFDSEKSYLDWESEMVSAKVMDSKYCNKTVSLRKELSHLSAQGYGLNKLVVIEVNSPNIA